MKVIESNVIIDFLVDLGLGVVKEKIGDAIIQKQARDRLTDYLLRQKKLNYNISKEEEIDFEGLVNYLKTDLAIDLKNRVLGKGIERKDARKRIIDKSIVYAKANTKLSVERTTKIVATSIDILSKYYKSKVNRELLFIASEIEETVSDEHQETRKHISDESKNIIQQLTDKMESSTFLSVDKSMEQIKRGEIKEVEDKMEAFMRAISTQHELHPYYKFGWTQDYKLFSQPANQEAAIKYPQRIKIKTSSMKLGEQQITKLDRNILSQAYRHQQLIYMDVDIAEQFLGEIRDPAQNISEELSGKQIVVKPPEFPPAFSCYVKAGKDIIVPYLLLRTKEILDDGTVIVTNKEQQNFPYEVSISLNPNNSNVKYTITVISKHNIDHLNYRKFIKYATSGESLSLVLSEKNQTIVSCNVDDYEYELLDEEIKFFEKIVKIEEYFGVEIEIPETISLDDHISINHLCALIDGEFTGHWTSFECRLIVSEELKEKFESLDNKKSTMAHSSINTFTIFNKEIEVPTLYIFQPAIIEDFERVKTKISFCDNNDVVKVVYVPDGETGDFKEMIYEGNAEELYVI